MLPGVSYIEIYQQVVSIISQAKLDNNVILSHRHILCCKILRISRGRCRIPRNGCARSQDGGAGSQDTCLIPRRRWQIPKHVPDPKTEVTDPKTRAWFQVTEVTDPKTRARSQDGGARSKDTCRIPRQRWQIWHPAECKPCFHITYCVAKYEHRTTEKQAMSKSCQSFGSDEGGNTGQLWLNIRSAGVLDAFPSVLLHCWLGDRKGVRPVQMSGVSLLVVMIWLEHCTSYNSSCYHSPPPSSLAPTKSRMETFWYRLTQVHLENGC